MSRITTKNGIQWSYNDQGEGPALVFLHGWGVNKDIWKQQVTYFKKKYRVLTIDLPGHGDTPWQATSLTEIANNIIWLLSELSSQNIHFAGSSMGGLIGLQMYKERPDIFQSLTFVGSLPKFVKSEDFIFGLEDSEVKKLTRQVSRQYPSIVNIFFRALFTRQEREDARFQWAQTFRRNQKMPDREALLSFLGLLGKVDLRPVLPTVNVPVLCINGVDDTIVPVEYLEYIKSEIPHAKCYRVERAGHFPFIIQAEAFNKKLGKFLKSHKDT